jgi:hypothetical protein
LLVDSLYTKTIINGPAALMLGIGWLFSFVILYSVSRTPYREDQPISRPLPTCRGQWKQNKYTQTSMPLMGFQPTTPADSSCLRPHSSVISTSKLQWQ